MCVCKCGLETLACVFIKPRVLLNDFKNELNNFMKRYKISSGMYKNTLPHYWIKLVKSITVVTKIWELVAKQRLKKLFVFLSPVSWM